VLYVCDECDISYHRRSNITCIVRVERLPKYFYTLWEPDVHPHTGYVIYTFADIKQYKNVVQ